MRASPVAVQNLLSRAIWTRTHCVAQTTPPIAVYTRLWHAHASSGVRHRQLNAVVACTETLSPDRGQVPLDDGKNVANHRTERKQQPAAEQRTPWTTGTTSAFGPAFYYIPHRNMSASAAAKQGLVAVEEARRFMVECLVKSKTPLSHAKQQADLLVEADYRGHFSHGMNRLEMYINDLHKNACSGEAEPTILNETPATAWVDGNNGLGAVVGNFCMDLAIKKAKEVGVGWVCAKRSNHYGIAGWYTLRAMNAGCIGMSMTNTSPLASPTRSKEAALGTNPISVGAPGKDGDGFVLDMATTAVAVGKIEMQRRKNEPIPVGWAQGPDGHPTTDASLAFDTACLMPLGGTELTSGYKGYGLGAMVEVFCGVLAGANYATKIRKWTHAGADSEADLGQCFVAINPACFAPGFEGRLSDLTGILRNMPMTDPEYPVLVAGDPERNHMAKVDKEGGLAYHVNQIKTCTELSERLGVKPIEVK